MHKLEDLHGGNIYRIAREKGIMDILDYSANINPLGISEKLKERVAESWDLFERYPDPHYVELRETLAHHSGVTGGEIVVGNGATEVIFLYCKVVNPKKALIVMPTFAEYERALRAAGCEVDYFQVKEEEDFTIDRERLGSQLEKGYDLLVVCNPNNPTGRFLPLRDMAEIAKLTKEKNCRLMVDEAFIEFVEGDYSESLANLGDENIFIVRALTKFFAIPGVRLGFGITKDMELIQRIQEDREPWTVNTLAEISAKVLLEDEDYIKRSKEWIRKEKDAMYEHLSKGRYIKPYKTDTNFILVKLTGSLNSKELRDRMIEKGVVIRDAANFPFLGDRYIRLAIKGEESNRLVAERVIGVTDEAR